MTLQITRNGTQNKLEVEKKTSKFFFADNFGHIVLFQWHKQKILKDYLLQSEFANLQSKVDLSKKVTFFSHIFLLNAKNVQFFLLCAKIQALDL